MFRFHIDNALHDPPHDLFSSHFSEKVYLIEVVADGNQLRRDIILENGGEDKFEKNSQSAWSLLASQVQFYKKSTPGKSSYRKFWIPGSCSAMYEGN